MKIIMESIEKLKIENQQKNVGFQGQIAKEVHFSESEDSDDIHMDPYQMQKKREKKKEENQKKIQQTRKSMPNALGTSLSAVDIKSKNGYLFEKRTNKIVETG